MTHLLDADASWPALWDQIARNLAAGWSWSGFERSAFFVRCGERFVDVAPVLGADQVSDGRALAAGDLDNDGDLDLVGTASRDAAPLYVLRNDAPADGHHLFLELVPGDARSAAGATVLLTAGGVTQRRDVALGSGYLSQGDTRLHFGLGAAAPVERVAIAWPDGARTTLTDLPVDRVVRVRQGADGYEERAHAARNFSATARLPEVEWDRTAGRLRRVPAPRPDLSWLRAVDADGAPVDLAVGAAGLAPDGPAVLVHLWATWCASCRRETPALGRVHAEAPAGMRVVGVALDERGPDEDAPAFAARVRATADAWGSEFPIVVPSPAERARLVADVAAALGLADPATLPLPTTILLAPDGRALAAAQGTLDVEAARRFVEMSRE